MQSLPLKIFNLGVHNKTSSVKQLTLHFWRLILGEACLDPFKIKYIYLFIHYSTLYSAFIQNELCVCVSETIQWVHQHIPFSFWESRRVILQCPFEAGYVPSTEFWPSEFMWKGLRALLSLKPRRSVEPVIHSLQDGRSVEAGILWVPLGGIFLRRAENYKHSL